MPLVREQVAPHLLLTCYSHRAAPGIGAGVSPKLLEVTPRKEGPSHLLAARALELPLPAPSPNGVRCDLVAASSEPLSRLMGAGG